MEKFNSNDIETLKVAVSMSHVLSDHEKYVQLTKLADYAERDLKDPALAGEIGGAADQHYNAYRDDRPARTQRQADHDAAAQRAAARRDFLRE